MIILQKKNHPLCPELGVFDGWYSEGSQNHAFRGMKISKLVWHTPVYSLSNFDIRRDVTRGKLHIPSELPLNTYVEYGIAAKHTRCMDTRLKYAIYRVWHHV